jgi:TatD DNase family protein
MSAGANVPLVDTHCHLHDSAFDKDRDEVIARARAAGVMAAFCMGEDYDDNLRLLDIAANEPFIRPALGHHPWRLDRAAKDVPRTLKLIEENREALAAVGEVGLDYRTAETEAARENQRAVFREFIGAAKDLGLPLSVHVRSAGHYVIDLLREESAGPAALHAFDGKARHALEGAAQGLYFSIPATVLVSPQKRKLVRALPLDRILLESDAPALGPERGGRNEPSIIRAVLEEMAKLRGDSALLIAETVRDSTAALFSGRP